MAAVVVDFAGRGEGPTSLLSQAAQRHPGRIALVSGGVSATFACLNMRVALFAGVLAYLGLARASRIALALDGDARQSEAALGVLRAGQGLVHLAEGLEPGEELRLLRSLEARVLIATHARARRLQAADAEALRRLLVITVDAEPGVARLGLDYEGALETAEASFHDAAGLPHDAALIAALPQAGRVSLSRLSHRALLEALRARDSETPAAPGFDLVALFAALAQGRTHWVARRNTPLPAESALAICA